MMALLGREISLTISSAVWIQCTNVTDRRTPGDSKDSAYEALTHSVERLKGTQRMGYYVIIQKTDES